MPEIIEAAHNPQIRSNLRDHVSEERIGLELDKMLEGNNPHLAVRDLHTFGVLPLLYKFPPDLVSEE